MWWLCALAQAQDPQLGELAQSERALQASAQELEASQQELATAQAELLRLQQALAAQGDQNQQLLDAAALALDPLAAASDRLAALLVVADSGNPASDPILRAAAYSRSAAVRAEAMRLSFLLSEQRGVALARSVAQAPQLTEVARGQALVALEQAKVQGAGRALIALSQDDAMPRKLRAEAGEAARRTYPTLVAEAGGDVGGSDPLGVALLTAGGAVTGGVMLSSIGVWGQSDAATTIGAIGGTAIGGGAALTYGLTQPLTLGQGARFATNVSWGLGGAALADEWLIAPVGSGSTESTEALFRVIGVGAGAGVGLWAMQHDPSAPDALETNVAGLVGMGLGYSTFDLVGSHCLWEECSISDEQRARRNLAGASLFGAGAAIGAQTMFRDALELSSADYTLAGLVSGQSTISTRLLVNTYQDANPEGSWRSDGVPLFVASSAAGLTLMGANFYEPATWEQVALGSWGAVLGNGIGAGLPLLFLDDTQQGWARTMQLSTALGGGAGLSAGMLLARPMEFSRGDIALQAMVVPLAMSEGMAIGTFLGERNSSFRSSQATGMMLTAGSLAGIAATASAPFIDPEAPDMAVVGTSALWGAWYGALLPIAFVPDGPSENILLTGSLGAALGAGAGLGLVYGVELAPTRTVMPQLLGVSGATIGALGVALATEDGQAIAGGALVGSTVGLVGGAYLESMRSRGEALVSGRAPKLDLPGEWAVMATPTAMEDGSLGGYLSVSAAGF